MSRWCHLAPGVKRSRKESTKLLPMLVQTETSPENVSGSTGLAITFHQSFLFGQSIVCLYSYLTVSINMQFAQKYGVTLLQ